MLVIETSTSVYEVEDITIVKKGNTYELRINDKWTYAKYQNQDDAVKQYIIFTVLMNDKKIHKEIITDEQRE